MILGGTLINAVVRIAVTVATLAAVYFFILQPILTTTGQVTSQVQQNVQRSLEAAERALDQSGVPTETVRSMSWSITHKVPAKNQQRLQRCISNGPLTAGHVQKCIRRTSKR